jgi:hypothetical protein
VDVEVRNECGEIVRVQAKARWEMADLAGMLRRLCNVRQDVDADLEVRDEHVHVQWGGWFAIKESWTCTLVQTRGECRPRALA